MSVYVCVFVQNLQIDYDSQTERLDTEREKVEEAERQIAELTKRLSSAVTQVTQIHTQSHPHTTNKHTNCSHPPVNLSSATLSGDTSLQYFSHNSVSIWFTASHFSQRHLLHPATLGSPAPTNSPSDVTGWAREKFCLYIYILFSLPKLITVSFQWENNRQVNGAEYSSHLLFASVYSCVRSWVSGGGRQTES